MGWVAGILSLIWFGAIGLYLSGWETGIAAVDKLLKLEPNNFGDFMSGAFAPAAFFWLAYSVWIQKTELKDTRYVLEKQQSELEKSAKASNSILAVNLENLKIENTNQKHNLMDNLLKNYYEISRIIQGIKFNFSDKTHRSVLFYSTFNNNIERPKTGLEVSNQIMRIISDIDNFDITIIDDENINRIERLKDLVGQILRIPDEHDEKDYSMMVLVDALELQMIHDAICALINKARNPL